MSWIKVMNRLNGYQPNKTLNEDITTQPVENDPETNTKIIIKPLFYNDETDPAEAPKITLPLPTTTV